jgi:hypothetical protein
VRYVGSKDGRRTDGSDEGARWTHVAREVLRETSAVLRACDHVQYIAEDVAAAAGTGDCFHRTCGVYAVWLECNRLFGT